MTVTLPLEILIQAFMLIAGVASVWGVMRSQLAGMRSTLKEMAPLLARLPQFEHRLLAVEAHGQKIDQIAPLMERVGQFEKRIEDQVGQMRGDMRDLASAVRDLAKTRA